jgi:hypothetical protein
MTPRDFVYWLQGYFEIIEAKHLAVLSDEQIKIIRRHLAMLPVAKYDQSKLNFPTYGQELCHELNYYLREAKEELSATKTLKVQRKLGELFVHVANDTNAYTLEPLKEEAF